MGKMLVCVPAMASTWSPAGFGSRNKRMFIEMRRHSERLYRHVRTQFYWQQHRAAGHRGKEVKVFHHLLAAARRMEPNEDQGRDVGCDTDDLCSRQPGPVSANDRQEVNADGAADPQGT